MSALCLAFLVQWCLLFRLVTPAWDAEFYYAYARSVVFDHDLHLQNDLLLSYPTTAADFAAKELHGVHTETGRMDTLFAVGSAVVWIPLLAVLKAVASVAGAVGIGPEVLTGYEWYFTGSISALSALSGLLAFWVLHRVARAENNKTSGLVATVTLMFATPLLYYQFLEPLYSHATSALVAGMCVYVWWRQHHSIPATAQSITLGGLIGLAVLIRWQNAIYVALPLVSTVWWWLELPAARKRAQWKQPVSHLLLAGCAALFVCSIQLATWKVFYGRWITIPQGGSFMDWTAPFLLPTLFSSYRGLLPWMPVALFSLIGLLLLCRRRPRFAVPLLVVLLLGLYVNASTRDWFGGGGFGPRRFTSELVILGVGYAAFLSALPGLVRVASVGALGLALALHQWILLRHGLEQHIGGRNLSMAPDFRWTDVSYAAFGQQILAHVRDIVHHPLDFLVFSGSPLNELLGMRTWPIRQGLALLTAATFVVLCLQIGKRAAGFVRLRSGVGRTSLILVASLVLAIDLWLLVWA